VHLSVLMVGFSLSLQYILAVLGFELRVLSLPGRCSLTLFMLVIFQLGFHFMPWLVRTAILLSKVAPLVEMGSHELLSQPDQEP
jgi:hypothetical protein